MKDYTKVKYAKATKNGLDITKGKVYIIESLTGYRCAFVFDDSNERIIVNLACDSPESVSDRDFIPCYKNGRSIPGKYLYAK